MTLSVLESFPHVRVYGFVFGFGYHVIASNDPIPRLSPEELVAAMPEAAVADMTEWNPSLPTSFFSRMLGNAHAVDTLLIEGSREKTVAITDDRPVNEFLLMRRFVGGGKEPPVSAGPQ